MLAPRCLTGVRIAARALASRSRPISTSAVARSGHVYGAEAVGAVMWWWVLWHLFHEYEHITGEFPYPDPSEWTDRELGIPPDSEGAAEKIA